MERKKLEELNLLDDFLFVKMVSYPDLGEKFIHEVLGIIFQKNFEKLTVIPQKVYYGADTDKHGARLDVLLEEENEEDTGKAMVYDLEPNNTLIEKYRASLPKRTRFYHAKIDAGSLGAGKKYDALKNVYVIMITPYDPFELDRMVYTVKNSCVEEPDMPYDDGARTLYLYTKGTQGNPSEELRQFLHYMEDTRTENATTEALQRIDRMVKMVKADGEVSLEYMKIFEREELLVEEGIQQGIRQGIQQGQEMERQNTERERQRAEAAELELERLKKEMGLLP